MHDAEEPTRVHEVVVQRDDAGVRSKFVEDPGLVEQGVDAVRLVAFEWVPAASGRRAGAGGGGQAPELLQRLIDFRISECVFDDNIPLGYNLIDQLLGVGIDLCSVPFQFLHRTNLIVDALVVACLLVLVDHFGKILGSEERNFPEFVWTTMRPKTFICHTATAVLWWHIKLRTAPKKWVSRGNIRGASIDFMLVITGEG